MNFTDWATYFKGLIMKFGSMYLVLIKLHKINQKNGIILNTNDNTKNWLIFGGLSA